MLFFGFVLFLLLQGCMSGPGEPVPRSEPVELILRANATLFSTEDTLKIIPDQTQCIKVLTQPDSVSGLLQYQWFIDNLLLDRTDSLCLLAASSDVGHGMVDITAEDDQGNTHTWGFPLLVNTEPRFSLLPSHYAPIQNIEVPYQSGRGVQFVWKVFDPDPQDTVRIELQWKNQSDSIRSTYTYDLTGLMLSNQFLAPEQSYQWRAIARDRYGAVDSSAWFNFSTGSSRQIPGAIIGRVTVPELLDMQRIRVLAFASTGDTISTALLADSSFILVPGYYDEDVQVQATLIDSNAWTSIDFVDANPLTPVYMALPLEFP